MQAKSREYSLRHRSVRNACPGGAEELPGALETGERGWPPDRYERWLGATLKALFVGAESRPGGA